MIVCIEKNNEKAQIIINNLEDEMPWAKFDWNKVTGEITEDLLLGKELWEKAGYTLLHKQKEITVFLQGKEHVICSKDENWQTPGHDFYNKQLTKAFWAAVSQNKIEGVENILSKKQLIQKEENG